MIMSVMWLKQSAYMGTLVNGGMETWLCGWVDLAGLYDVGIAHWRRG